jgi:ABC-type dipeptide/oligopeptide/nickel transport system ATPase component
MSRVINQKNSRPNSDDLIAAIAENADPDSGVTLQELLEAHGLALITVTRPIVLGTGGSGKSMTSTQILLQMAEKVAQGISSPSGELITETAKKLRESAIERTAREIIQNELLIRGYRVSMILSENVMSTPSLRYVADFVVETNALEEEGISRWAFDIHQVQHRPLLQKLSWMFGAAYIDSTFQRKIKMSLVTSDRTEFEDVKDRFSHIEIKDCISVVLIDTLKRSVIEEFQLPMQNGRSAKYVFNQSDRRVDSKECGVSGAEETE